MQDYRIYYAGCNYNTNQGHNMHEPLGTATSMHDCIECENVETCTIKKTTEVWEINEDEIKRIKEQIRSMKLL